MSPYTKEEVQKMVGMTVTLGFGPHMFNSPVVEEHKELVRKITNVDDSWIYVGTHAFFHERVISCPEYDKLKMLKLYQLAW